MRAVLDACVLYPTFLREVLLGVAKAGVYTPLWSARLLEEWRRAAARNGGATDAAFAELEAEAAARRFPNALVPPGPEAAFWLPDPADIHVLATAVAGQADLIITLNLKDFPRRELEGYGVSARSPDEVLMTFWAEANDPIEAAVVAAHRAAEAHAGQSLPLRPLMKRARLPRLGKALTA